MYILKLEEQSANRVDGHVGQTTVGWKGGSPEHFVQSVGPDTVLQNQSHVEDAQGDIGPSGGHDTRSEIGRRGQRPQ